MSKTTTATTDQNSGGGAAITGADGKNPQNVPPANPPVDPKTPSANAFSTLKFIAEIDCGNNNQVQFMCWPKQGKILRGKYSIERMGMPVVDQRLKDIPKVIPGILIVFDGSKRQIGFFDPFNQKSNESILKAMESTVEKFYGEKQRPEHDQVYKEFDDDQGKTFLWWMRRLWDSSSIVMHKNTEVPSMAVIRALPGSIMHQPMARHEKTRYDPPVNTYISQRDRADAERAAKEINYEADILELMSGR